MLAIQRRIVVLCIVFSVVACSPTKAPGELVGVISNRNLADSFLFTIDPTTGAADTANALTIHTGGTGAMMQAVSHITGVAFHPSSGILYAHQNNAGTQIGSLYTVNTQTGAAVRLGATGRNITDLTFTPNGTLYGWAGGIQNPDPGTGLLNDLVTIDLTSTDGGSTVTTTYVGDSGINTTNRAGLASDATGNLFLKTGNEAFAAQTPGNLYSINSANGAGTLINTVNGLATNALTIDHGTGTAYTVDITSSGTLLKTISLTNGNLSAGINMGSLQVTGIAFNNATAVPEPSSIALLSLLCVVPVASRLRNNRRRKSHSSILAKGS